MKMQLLGIVIEYYDGKIDTLSFCGELSRDYRAAAVKFVESL